MKRLLITGSQNWTDEATIRRELASRYEPGMVLVSGHCPKGADPICESVWEELGGRVERHPADWKKHGRRAGLIRNARMVRLGAGECLAFNQDGSGGTSHCSGEAHYAGIPVSTHQPSAENYDYQAGVLFRAGRPEEAAHRIQRARIIYPHSPERELWDKRGAQIQAAIDARADQQALFGREAVGQ
jgi:hypothetical protein